MMTEFNTETKWSAELLEKMQSLPPRQRRGIIVIVTAELQGISLNRMLRRPNSCRWCGLTCGSAEQRTWHEAHCERQGQPSWPFVTTNCTYYQRWYKSTEFKECLELARQEAAIQALGQASQILQMATPGAASELRRQVEAGQKDSDRRQAAVAILDRADIKTSPKRQVEQLSLWLDDLRAEDEGQEGKNQ